MIIWWWNMKDKCIVRAIVSLKYHRNYRKNLLIYEEMDIMLNEKSTLNSCNIDVLCHRFRGFGRWLKFYSCATALYIHKWQTYWNQWFSRGLKGVLYRLYTDAFDQIVYLRNRKTGHFCDLTRLLLCLAEKTKIRRMLDLADSITSGLP